MNFVPFCFLADWAVRADLLKYPIMGKTKDYEHPMKPFFHCLVRLIRLINSGAFGVFSAKLSAPIWYVFHYSSIISKKLSLYIIHIPNIFLGLGFEFEFGLQRIRDLAFVCP